MTDTLLPTKGYWIKASQPAKMFLNASGDCTENSNRKYFAHRIKHIIISG